MDEKRARALEEIRVDSKAAREDWRAFPESLPDDEKPVWPPETAAKAEHHREPIKPDLEERARKVASKLRQHNLQADMPALRRAVQILADIQAELRRREKAAKPPR